MLVAALLIGCGRPAPVPPAAGEADDFGQRFPPTIDARRLVSLDPAVTEILFALGLGERLVGRTHWDAWSDSVRAIDDLGNGIGPNVEAVLATRPGLVFLYATPENRAAAGAWNAAGVAVVAFRIDRVADFGRVAAALGRLTDREARAHAVVDSVMSTLESVRRATAGLARRRVFLPAWENPLIAIGGGSFLSELVAAAGGENIFGDVPAPSPQVSFEEVLRRNPDAVLVSPGTASGLRDSPRWRALAAVREGRILVMDTLLVARPALRLGEAAASLARLLHPGVLP